MRVLMVHCRYQIRGGEDECYEAEQRLLREAGVEVDGYEDDNRRVERQGKLRTAVATVWSKSTYDAVRARLRAKRYDLVHVHNFFPLISPAVYHAAQAEGCAVIQTLHNYRTACPAGTFYRDGRVCEDCLGRKVPWPGVVHGCYRGSRAGTAAVAAMIAGHRLIGTWQNKVDLYIALNEFMRAKAIAGGLPAHKIVIKPNFVRPRPGRRRWEGRLCPVHGPAQSREGRARAARRLAAPRRAHPAQDRGRRSLDRRGRPRRGREPGDRLSRPAPACRVLRAARPGALLHLHLDLVRGLPARDRRGLCARHADRRVRNRADRRAGRRRPHRPAFPSGRRRRPGRQGRLAARSPGGKRRRSAMARARSSKPNTPPPTTAPSCSRSTSARSPARARWPAGRAAPAAST